MKRSNIVESFRLDNMLIISSISYRQDFYVLCKSYINKCSLLYTVHIDLVFSQPHLSMKALLLLIYYKKGMSDLQLYSLFQVLKYPDTNLVVH